MPGDSSEEKAAKFVYKSLNRDMLLAGEATKGVAYSARGSQLGLFLTLPLLIFIRIFFGPELNLYDDMRSSLPWILLTISFLLLITETTRLPWPCVLYVKLRGLH